MPKVRVEIEQSFNEWPIRVKENRMAINCKSVR